VGDFLSQRLQNYEPQVKLVPARRRGTAMSPDNADILTPLLEADLIFMGPGSPSYTVRQLRDSLAWHYLVARHRLGAGLALASAATIAISTFALPVYEIFKVGEEIHWKEGLDLLGAFGLPAVFVPHWNNTDGGDEVDTSRCFMGLERFEPLLSMLPVGQTIIGIDEKTGLLIEFGTQQCIVIGNGGVTLLREGQAKYYAHGGRFDLQELGNYQVPIPGAGIPREIWQAVLDQTNQVDLAPEPPEEVHKLVSMREEARQGKEWEIADKLRQQIAAMGWQVKDTVEGPVLEENL
jgi:hypothetical protein